MSVSPLRATGSTPGPFSSQAPFYQSTHTATLSPYPSSISPDSVHPYYQAIPSISPHLASAQDFGSKSKSPKFSHFYPLPARET